MAIITHSKSARTQSGRKVTYTHEIDGSAVVGDDPLLAAAKVGVLTVRTNGTDGTLTMNSGHGITTGATIDIYGASGVSYKATAGTVSGNSVPFTGASGDALPTEGDAVTVMVPTSVAFVVTYASLKSLLVGCDGIPMVARFVSSVPGDITTIVIKPGGTGGYVWNADDPAGGSNPFGTTNCATVKLSHGSSSASRRPIAEAIVA